MADFTMPSLGADMTVATLVAWNVKPGDRVKKGDLIADVETDKGLIAIEVFGDGVVEKLLVEPGSVVPVGSPLAILREDGAAAAPPPPVAAAAATGRPSEFNHPAAPPPAPWTPPVFPEVRGVRASPFARRRARELGVDLATITGTAHGGAISVEDVERAASLHVAKPAAPAAPAARPAATRTAERMRKPIAAAMSRSKREIPHFYLAHTIDLGPLHAWLEEQNDRRKPADRFLAAMLFVRAVARAAKKVPELNARYENGEVAESAAVNVGLAISLREGLIAPAISNVETLSLDELRRAFADVIARARGGGLRASELASGTITVTSLGDRGVDTVYPIIFPPQVAMVGFGKIVERPWAVDGMLAVRPVVTVTLAADHRVCDGHRAGLFLAEIEHSLMEKP